MEQYIPIKFEGTRKSVLKALEGIPLPFAIEIQKISSKRSAAQNRLYWAFLGDIAEQMEVPDKNGVMQKYSKDEWHDLCRMKFLGVKILSVGDKEYPRPSVSTKRLKVSEFAEYLTKIESHFLEKGVVLTYTEDYGPAIGESHE